MNLLRITTGLMLASLGVITASSASASVALTILPDREQVQIRFEDSGAVLVEEARTLTLNKGTNHISLTWLGVDIDRSSIQLLHVSGVPFQLQRVTYPPGQDNSQEWEVSVDNPGASLVRISYLLQGISREVFYRAVVSEGASPTMALRIYQKLDNASGETYSSASLHAAFGELRDSPLATGEIRQMLTAHYADVPFTKRYSYDSSCGDKVQVSYVMNNTQAGKLGNGLLPAGKLRLFQQTGESEAFLGEDRLEPTASGEKIEVHIGDSRDLVVRRVELSSHTEVLQKDSDGHQVLWNQLKDMRFEVENFTDDVKDVDLTEHLSGEWDVTNPVQVLEKRIAPEQYEVAKGENNPAGTLERKSVDSLIIHLSVPKNRRMTFTCTLRELHLH